MKSLSVLILFLTVQNLNAAPHPGVASGQVVQSAWTQMFAAKGFDLTLNPLQWKSLQPISPQTKDFEFANKQHPAIKAAVKITSHDGHESFENLKKKWTQDYAQFGFEILKIHPSSHLETFTIDLYHREKAQLIRQKIQVRKGSVATMTCYASTQYRTELSQVCP